MTSAGAGLTLTLVATGSTVIVRRSALRTGGSSPSWAAISSTPRGSGARASGAGTGWPFDEAGESAASAGGCAAATMSMRCPARESGNCCTFSSRRSTFSCSGCGTPLRARLLRLYLPCSSCTRPENTATRSSPGRSMRVSSTGVAQIWSPRVVDSRLP
ncbi:hypothetical protein G6F57_021371 [Rhizopus arrhizus]|nr:hypothetical protein G6F57_021371 [Rhizopus arrhizus]